MRIKLSLWLAAICLVKIAAAQTGALPVIDMHLHALHANEQGPAPISIGAPFRDLGLNDPKNDFRKTFTDAQKTNIWADKYITSPTTDDSMKNMTLAMLKKYNVYAVTSGEMKTVREWKKDEPRRIINSID